MALLSIGTGRPGSKGGGLRLIKKIRIDYFRAPSFPYVLPLGVLESSRQMGGRNKYHTVVQAGCSAIQETSEP